MEFALPELHVELTLKDHQLELAFASVDSPAIMEFVPVALQEPFGAQLPVNASTFVDKTQSSQPLLMLVFAMLDLDC